MKKMLLLAMLTGLSSWLVAGLELKETFCSCGYYWNRDAAVPELKVEYRQAGGRDWQRGLDPAWFAGDKMYRGSLVGLREATDYEVRLLTRADRVLATGTFRTWSSEVPVGRTVDLSRRSRNGTIRIGDKGTPAQWVRFTVPAGTVIDGDRSSGEAAIELDGAEYVIIDGVTVRGGLRHGIKISNSRHVRVVNCDLGGWGRSGKMGFFPRLYLDRKGHLINSDSGIWIEKSVGVVVERCFIHDPRSPSTGWTYGHPVGPDALIVNQLEQTVIRYNDLIGTDERRWNDVIESRGNFTPDGGFNRDADIYGNFFAFPHDDGIELDGGQMNVRLFGNKFEGGLTGVSVTTCVRGPSYIFRNLIVNLGDYDGNGSLAFKDLDQKNQCGLVYYFNNTVYSDGNGFVKTPPRRFGRNNLLCCGDLPCSAQVAAGRIDFDYDLLWSLKGLREHAENVGAGAVTKRPLFVDAAKGLWALRAGSPGTADGVAVPGFASGRNGRSFIGAFAPGSRKTGPLRPAPFDTDRGQILFGTVGNGKAAAVKVKVDVDGDFRGTLRIRKNDSFGWFGVSPAEVTVKPGEQVEFEVTLQPEMMPISGLYSGAFIIRGEDGMSRPVSVYARRAGNTEAIRYPGQAIVLPAAAPTSGQAPIEAVPGALNGKALSLDPAGCRDVMTWRFQVPRDGDYYILLHCLAKEPKMVHNELHWALDGAELKHLRLNLSGGRWCWAGIANPARPPSRGKWVRSRMGYFRLQAGTHEIRLKPQEQLYLDRILVTPDFELQPGNVNNFSGFTPVGMSSPAE